MKFCDPELAVCDTMHVAAAAPPNKRLGRFRRQQLSRRVEAPLGHTRQATYWMPDSELWSAIPAL